MRIGDTGITRDGLWEKNVSAIHVRKVSEGRHLICLRSACPWHLAQYPAWSSCTRNVCTGCTGKAGLLT